MTHQHARTGMIARFALAVALGLGALVAAPASQAAQTTFASPEDAAESLVQAVKSGQRNAVLTILGGDTGKWITSGDAVADRNLAQRFVAAYEEHHRVAADGDKRATLLIGSDDWPFAFPIVKAGTRWHFDAAAGKHELLARRIGENELAVINVMLAVVDAQRDYALGSHTRDGVPQYAKKFASSPGKQDGLYWPTKAGEPESPLGPLVTRATGEGYRPASGSQPSPYHGYYFRMLTAQGEHAKGGAMSYVVKGWMIGGFAAVAYPAQYDRSGVMTFIVDQDGVVYQRDLGPDTAKKARAMTKFDPGVEWTPVPAK